MVCKDSLQLRNNHKKVLIAARSLNKPLLESDIVAIHEMFLSCGIHYFTTDQIISANLAIDILFPVLTYYSKPGCLSLEKTSAISDNCYQLLEDLHFTNKPYEFHEFFLDYFKYDFFWINLTHELFSQDWFSSFYETLHELRIDRSIPIVISFDNQ